MGLAGVGVEHGYSPPQLGFMPCLFPSVQTRRVL
jgi:hypothetical protein